MASPPTPLERGPRTETCDKLAASGSSEPDRGKTWQVLVGANQRLSILAGVLAVGLMAPFAAAADGSRDISRPPSIFGGGPDLGPHQIRLLAGGSEVEFSGGMSAGAAQELRQVLDANPGVGVVHLNSNGGLVSEGRQMFALLHELQIITTSDKYCVSACVLAFLGGRERYLAPAARLGLHEEFSDVVSKSQVEAFEQSDKQLMQSLGIPADFVNRAFSTPRDAVWVPSVGELEAANVITGISPDYIVALRASGKSAGEDAISPTGANGKTIYKPPSVEVTPAGVTIYRGSGAP